jgi:hypothetical protein
LALFACVAILAAYAVPAGAATMTFSDRTTWETAAGGASYTVDFNGVASDTSFSGAAYDAGPFTLEAIGTGLVTWTGKLDASPFESGGFWATDATTYALMETDFGNLTNEMVFDLPVLAWGADFVSALSGELLDLQLVDGGTETVQLDVNTGFFGVTTDMAIAKIIFKSRLEDPGPNDEIFGMDNVSAAAVPEPSAVTLFGIGSLIVGAYISRRSKQI